MSKTIHIKPAADWFAGSDNPQLTADDLVVLYEVRDGEEVFIRIALDYQAEREATELEDGAEEARR